MSEKTPKRNGRTGTRNGGDPGDTRPTGTDIPQKISTGFALMALVPILLAVLLLIENGRDPGVFIGRTGAVLLLMIACAILGFYFIKAELARTFLAILEQANRMATGRMDDRMRAISADEIGRISETISRISESLEGRPAEGQASKERMNAGIAKVAHALHTARDEEGLLKLLVEGVVETTGARTAWLAGVDEESGDFRTRAAAGECCEAALEHRVPLGEGVPGRAARERRPILLQDDEAAVLPRTGAAAKGAASTIAAPLLQGETLHGVLIVQDRTDGGRFGEEDLGLLANLTNLTAVALGQWTTQTRLRDDLDAVVAAFSRAIESRDPYARGRSERVAKYCEAMARAMQLDEDTIRTLRRAALLHAVGKVSLPDSILRKETALTEEELEHVRTYAATGEAILKDVPVLATVRPMIRHHNERCDGSGYPDALSGDSIPLTTHLLIVAHAFDAMTSDRAFRRALSVREAIDRLQKGAGKEYDRRAVKALIGLDRAVLEGAPRAAGNGATTKGKGAASISVRE